MYLHVPLCSNLIFAYCTIQKKFVTLQRKSTVRMMKGHDIWAISFICSKFSPPLPKARIGIGGLFFYRHSANLGSTPPLAVLWRKECRAQAVELGEGSARTNILGKPFPTSISVWQDRGQTMRASLYCKKSEQSSPPLLG